MINRRPSFRPSVIKLTTLALYIACSLSRTSQRQLQIQYEQLLPFFDCSFGNLSSMCACNALKRSLVASRPGAPMGNVRNCRSFETARKLTMRNCETSWYWSFASEISYKDGPLPPFDAQRSLGVHVFSFDLT